MFEILPRLSCWHLVNMAVHGRLQKNIVPFAVLFSYMLGISCASHLKGHLEIFFPNEIRTINLASLGTFCVAKPNADPTLLKTGIDWACGPGSANCGPVQPGQPCYVANNLVAVASYVYDAYYQANLAKGATCSFGNTAMLTNTDPSTGSCIFPGSSGSGTNPGGGGGGSNSPGGGGGGSNSPGGSGTPPGGSGTSPGGSGTPPGGSGTSPGGSGISPGGSIFAPPFQPTSDYNGVSVMQGLNLLYLPRLVFLYLLIL